jgi:hypothetical protein
VLHRARIAFAVLVATTLIPVASAHATLTPIGVDPFTNSDSQHRTAVEPDTFAFGSTTVAAAQLGRYVDGGSSGIGYAYSTDSGATWTSGGALPGLTDNNSNGGSFNRATDPAVAYDAKHNVWLIISLGLSDTSGLRGTGVVVNRSTNGGATFGNPATVAAAGRGNDFDKTWIACDNTSTSRFYGNCYATWDDFAHGDAIKMTTSSDGGLTWGRPQGAAGASGLGGQPLVQPNGTVIVPMSNAYETAIGAFRSTNGGAKWSAPVLVANVSYHNAAANLRNGPLPTAEIGKDGKVYVAWQSCRLGVQGCPSNDIVMSSSTDGVSWSGVTRIPINDGTSSDHFIPGLAADPTTSGATTHLGLTYYYYPTAACGSSCTLGVGYVQSNDAGATWSDPTVVVTPFNVNWIANTSQGLMVGDYMSTSWNDNGTAWPALSVANSGPIGGAFDQNLYVPSGGLSASSFPNSASAAVGAAPANGQGSAHRVLRSRR